MRAPTVQKSQSSALSTEIDLSELEVRVAAAGPPIAVATEATAVQQTVVDVPAPVAANVERPAIEPHDPRLAAINYQAPSHAAPVIMGNKNPFDQHLPSDPLFQARAGFTNLACVVWRQHL